ncbi:F0F1 ATP synthase subunit delta [Alteromonas pelagimontana]|uniref:ATP synthase subunit delta n=1 Tax=Alteromonas pelagimontana TaxID=1858656 RepID=A0A6M4MCW6_9ALTE|nr:F0F1 ATP synthase subunit delta [Alteromonas pelagimontana]QJR80962.1 F0F1 ATP synthase subunit delta [Alteromonas pelagimontana]
MSELTTVARPYAKAAFDFAVEHNAIAQWQDMLNFAGAVSSNKEMHQYLTGAVAPDTLADIFINVCGEQLDQHGQNLVKVLAENKRLAVLPDISEMFDAFKAEYEKQVDVDVTSAIALTDAQKSELSATLEKRLARKVKLNCNVDPALIAGFIVKAGDTVIDGSVKSKLNRLADALQA